MTGEERHFRLRRAHEYGLSKCITCGDSLAEMFRATTLHGVKEPFGT